MQFKLAYNSLCCPYWPKVLNFLPLSPQCLDYRYVSKHKALENVKPFCRVCRLFFSFCSCHRPGRGMPVISWSGTGWSAPSFPVWYFLLSQGPHTHSCICVDTVGYKCVLLRMGGVLKELQDTLGAAQLCIDSGWLVVVLGEWLKPVRYP